MSEQVVFNLASIAAFLEGLEESIIYKLLDRAQFSRNTTAYQAGFSGFQAYPLESCLSLRLRFQEEMDARFGRFLVPEERPYSKSLPLAERQMRDIPLFPLDDISCISQNVHIHSAYILLLDKLCLYGDDGQYGSSVEHDVYSLQAIARRIHYGSLYVAESKFLEQRSTFTKLAQDGDDAALMKLLTRPEVEERILARVAKKVDAIQGIVNPTVRRIIDPELVLSFYRDTIIPLTKQGELAYLKLRHKS